MAIHPIKRKFIGSATKKAHLVKGLRRDLGRREHAPPYESVVALVEESKRAIEGYLRAPKALRPAEIAKQLTLLSKHLTNAAGVASTLGEQGWLIMAISSGANREAAAGDFTRHLLYLERLAAWSIKAAETAEDLAESAEDHRGDGRQTIICEVWWLTSCSPTSRSWVFFPLSP